MSAQAPLIYRSSRNSSTTVVAAILAFASLPVAVDARCFIDNNGFRRCNGLSNAARIALGVAIPVAILLCLCASTLARRRRIRRANMSYVTQGPQPYGNQPPTAYGNDNPGLHQPGYNNGGYNPGGFTGGNFQPPPGPPPPGYDAAAPQRPENVHKV